MKVYIVRGYWDYEGSRILGVYLTEGEAQARWDSIQSTDEYAFDRYGIDEIAVGEACYE